MAELVDARVSKTRSLGSAGSIPAARTKPSVNPLGWQLSPSLEQLIQTFGTFSIEHGAKFCVRPISARKSVAILPAQRPDERIAAFLADFAVCVPHPSIESFWVVLIHFHLRSPQQNHAEPQPSVREL
jgi:hypothetical protein